MKPFGFVQQWVVTAGSLISVLCSLPSTARGEWLSSVTFDNKSGKAALVKLVGPTTQAVEVPDGQLRTVKTAPGRYYILVRYNSNPDQYRYTKGEPFDVEEKETATGTEYSEITITLHPVVAGNYSTEPSSKDEFDKAVVGVTPSKEDEPQKPPSVKGEPSTLSIPVAMPIYKPSEVLKPIQLIPTIKIPEFKVVPPIKIPEFKPVTVIPVIKPVSVLPIVGTICVPGGKPADPAEIAEINLTWQSSGVGLSETIHPITCKGVPDELKKAPSDLGSPVYGRFRIGPRESPATIIVILDKRKGLPERLFVDSNGNGDLTDDPAVRWDKENRVGDATVKIPYAGGTKDARVLVVWHRGIRHRMEDTLFCAADFGLMGQVKLGTNNYRARLEDRSVGGDFRGRSLISQADEVALWLDINGDGEFTDPNECFDVTKPFSLAGTTWEIVDMTAEGSFGIKKSSIGTPSTIPSADDLGGKTD